jgi:hypothetical protein
MQLLDAWGLWQRCHVWHWHLCQPTPSSPSDVPLIGGEAHPRGEASPRGEAPAPTPSICPIVISPGTMELILSLLKFSHARGGMSILLVPIVLSLVVVVRRMITMPPAHSRDCSPPSLRCFVKSSSPCMKTTTPTTLHPHCPPSSQPHHQEQMMLGTGGLCKVLAQHSSAK